MDMDVVKWMSIQHLSTKLKLEGKEATRSSMAIDGVSSVFCKVKFHFCDGPADIFEQDMQSEYLNDNLKIIFWSFLDVF